ALGESELGPREAEAIARAVPKRRTEFARGRACAREALRRAGCGVEASVGAPDSSGFVEIPVGASRAPVWPEGFTGSITHCDGFVAAVVARTGVLRGIGLDAEPDRPLPDGVAAQVLTPEEQASPPDSLHDIVRFSAKESIHKAVFPLTGVWLDFLDVALELDDGAFRARPAAGARVTTPVLDGLAGRYTRVAGVVVTVAWVPRL
ncbi:MAG: 4'-phosphopantetheinyl transferase superfamily protein, partial [Gemmatimonadota bacterium]